MCQFIIWNKRSKERQTRYRRKDVKLTSRLLKNFVLMIVGDFQKKKKEKKKKKKKKVLTCSRGVS